MAVADITPEEWIKRRRQVQPTEASIDKPKPEGSQPAKTISHRPMDGPYPDDRAREAIGLQKGEPAQEPSHLSPRTHKALDALDPKTRKQVMGVIGCMEAFMQKADDLAQKVSSDMQAAVQRIRKVSLMERLVLRRLVSSRNVTTGEVREDVELAHSVINKTAQSAPTGEANTGIAALFAQQNELLGAVGDMRKQLKTVMANVGINDDINSMLPALKVADEAIGETAGVIVDSMNGAFGRYRTSDRERIATLLQEQGKLDQQVPEAVFRR